MKKTAIAAAVLLATAGSAQANIWTMTDGSFDFYDAAGNLSSQYPDGFSHNDVQGSFDLDAGTGSFSTSTPFSGTTWSTEFTHMQFGPQTPGAAPIAAEFNWVTRTYEDTFDGSTYDCNLSGNLQSGCDDYINPPNPSYNYTLVREVDTATDTLRSGEPNLATGYQFELGVGQMAAGVFFDWTTNIDIPVLAVMQIVGQGVTADGKAYMDIISVDADGDGVPGVAMQTDPFPGQTPSFSGRLICQDCPPPAPVPVPAAVWLFGSGLIGLAGVARRRKTV